MKAFKDQFASGCIENSNICAKYSSIIVAILSAGTILGSFLAAPIGDFFGRRRSLVIAVMVFCIGAILQVCADSIPLLLVGRCLAGVGVGAISVLVPMYQSEMAPKWIRGTLVCAYQLSITVGLLAASVVNILTSEMESSGAYRIPLGLQILPALVLTAGLLVLPETPRFLVKKGRKDEAGLSLSRLRRLDITHPALIEELHEINANHQYELSLGPDTYKDIFVGSPHLGRRTLTGCILQMLQQLTGINFIMYYGTTFFGGTGVNSPHTKSLIINVINVVSTIPGLLVIESWGRRRLLISGAIGMAVCQLFMATFATVTAQTGPTIESTGSSLPLTTQNVIIAFCAINIFFFAASWGPVAWVVTSEIYPLKTRAKAMSVSTASNWVLNFGIAYSTPYMFIKGPDSAGFGPKIFFVWGSFCVFAAIFVWCMVFETSKISLEQIDEMYERVNYAWNSKSFEPSWSFQQIVDEGWSPSGIPDHEMQSTASHTSADTTLGDASSSTISIDDHPPPSGPRRSSDSKAVPMANVDFSY